MKNYTVKVTKHDDATIEMDCTLSWEAFAAFEKRALARLGEHLELPGFRKGHIPEEVVGKQLGDELILSDMAELAIQELYPTLLEEEKIDAIGRPSLSITKIARGNELAFTLRTAVVPAFTLPDYKSLAATVAPIAPAETTDADVEKVIENLRHLRAYGHVHEEGHDHGHTEPLPEVDDAFAKSFGEFTSVEELKMKVRENVSKEKEVEARSARRAAILEAVVEQTSFVVPSVIVESEQDKLYAQIEADIAHSGLSMEEYLKQANKTKEQIMEEYKPEAEKRARMQLVINAIARKENIAANDEEVRERSQTLMTLYPGADKARTEAYADMVITNEKVLDFLESSTS